MWREGDKNMEKVFIDTNIFLRYLTKEDPAKYEQCREIFKRAMDGELSLFTSEMVVAELIWTLLSYYKVAKADVIEKVSIIISSQNLHISNRDLIADSSFFTARRTSTISMLIMPYS